MCPKKAKNTGFWILNLTCVGGSRLEIKVLKSASFASEILKTAFRSSHVMIARVLQNFDVKFTSIGVIIESKGCSNNIRTVGINIH